METKSSYLLITFALLLILSACKQPRMEDTQPIDDVTATTDYYQGTPLKVAVIGLVHTHVHWILGREKWGDIEIVGIVEPNRELAQRYSEQHGYSMDIVFDSMDALYEQVKPEAVTAFNTIYDHLEVVRFFAPKGVHVMVEKPLAVNWEHAQQMAVLARTHGIALLTNYETSWYGSNQKAYEWVNKEHKIGAIQRMVFHHGHPGPEEIGVNSEFLEWLIDPVQNGGGALTDFCCYGANLATWFLSGETPNTVTAITRQYKPGRYPEVEDDATIVLDYDTTQVIIQASWNWSHNRKDMEIYGKTGYVHCLDGTAMAFLENESEGVKNSNADALPMGLHDPFAFLNQIVAKGYQEPRFGVSSLENNLITMQILEAAKASAEMGRSIDWDAFFGTNAP